MRVLVTGATGFLGRALVAILQQRGHEVWGLVRKQPANSSFLPLLGDIRVYGMGLAHEAPDFDAVYHLGAVLDLSPKAGPEVWQTNVHGTLNVAAFCVCHHIPHLYYVSTAYTFGRNPYELSKEYAERWLQPFRRIHRLAITTLKPSVIVPRTLDEGGLRGPLFQFVRAIATFHRRAEGIRRQAESSLLLPPVEPVLRLKGNPQGKANLIAVQDIARAVADIAAPGTFWLTNPHPLMLKDVAEWVGEVLRVRIKLEEDFRMSAVEALVHRAVRPFEPYLSGDDLPSDLAGCLPIGRDEVQALTMASLL